MYCRIVGTVSVGGSGYLSEIRLRKAEALRRATGAAFLLALIVVLAGSAAGTGPGAAAGDGSAAGVSSTGGSPEGELPAGPWFYLLAFL